MRLKLLVEERGHCLIKYYNIENTYVNKKTFIIIGCKKHGLIQTKEKVMETWSLGVSQKEKK